MKMNLQTIRRAGTKTMTFLREQDKVNTRPSIFQFPETAKLMFT